MIKPLRTSCTSLAVSLLAGVMAFAPAGYSADVSSDVSEIGANQLPQPKRPGRVSDLRAERAAARARAAQWFRAQRSYPASAISPVIQAHPLLASIASQSSSVSQTRWEPIGPAPIENVTAFGDGDLASSGRALAIAIHPANADLLLLGAAQGGIWRSTNGGRNFLPVADHMPSLAIKVIRFSPSNPNVVYAGTGEPHSKTSIFGMGVLKSTDAGQTWTALPASGAGWDFRYLSVSGLQVDSRDENKLFVTIANVPADRIDAFIPPPKFPLTGIFKSTDGGQSWRLTQPAIDYRGEMYEEYDPYEISGIGFMDLELFQPDPNVLFATEFSGGIYRSTDAGEHWVRITPVKNPGNGSSDGPNFPAPVPHFAYFDPDKFTLTRYDVLPHPVETPEFSRIEMTLSQGGGRVTSDYHTAVLYAGFAAVIRLDVNDSELFDPDQDFQVPTSLLFKSIDGGDSWEWLGDWSDGIPNYCDTVRLVIDDHPFIDGIYDNTVEINPTNPDEIVIGGNANYSPLWPDPIDDPVRMLSQPWVTGLVYRSIDGGRTWSDTTPACAEYEPDSDGDEYNGLPIYTCLSTPSELVIHPDVHAAAFEPGGGRFYAASDGGLSRCTLVSDGAQGERCAWEDVNNNLGTLQIFNFDSHPTEPDFVISAMQDNAAAAWNGTFSTAWDCISGDGTVAAFDPLDPQYVYYAPQNSLYRNDVGGNNNRDDWKRLLSTTIGDNDTLSFVTILGIDPVASENLYVGSTTGVYRSSDRGDTWLARLNAEPTDGEITAISVSPVDHSLVWAGTSTGHIYLYQIAPSGEVLQVSDRTRANLPNRWITRVEASHNSSRGATFTLSGYDATSVDPALGGNGRVGRVFKTHDFGKSWRNISGNLTAANDLDVPVSGLALDPSNRKRLWIGTDIGVFQTLDGGRSWTNERGNMPLSAVISLDYNPQTAYLNAATFGRSIWRMPVR